VQRKKGEELTHWGAARIERSRRAPSKGQDMLGRGSESRADSHKREELSGGAI